MKASEQSWAQGLSEKSHRLKESWRHDRYAWLDESGVPIKPDYKRLATTKSITDMEETEYCAQEETTYKVAGQEFEDAHVDISDLRYFQGKNEEEQKNALQGAEFQKHPRMRRLMREIDQNVRGGAEKKRRNGDGVRRREPRESCQGKLLRRISPISSTKDTAGNRFSKAWSPPPTKRER